MARRRPAIPKRTEKRVYQEAQSQCPFCGESEVATFQIHHIDSDPTNNAIENLILTCASCHSKITAGLIFLQKVMQVKHSLSSNLESTRKRTNTDSTSKKIVISRSNIGGDVANNITKITTSKTIKTTHPPGSIGADLIKKGYIDELIACYFDLRKADASYGRKVGYSYPAFHRNIQKKFGFKTFFMPVSYFDTLVEYLQGRIDCTIQGKNNRSKGYSKPSRPRPHGCRHCATP